jgi:hypothetical protein
MKSLKPDDDKEWGSIMKTLYGLEDVFEECFE